MAIVRIDRPTPELGTRLDEFERSFTYPLGGGGRFSIRHVHPYDGFFRALGDHCCLAMVAGDRVLATIGAARRRLRLADGQTRSITYIGDLKVAPAARVGTGLLRLTRELAAWIGRDTCAFGVVIRHPAQPGRGARRLQCGRLPRIDLPRLPALDRRARYRRR